MDFIDVVIDSDPTTLVDDAVANLTTTLQTNGFPGYQPADGDLEILLLNEIAQMVADWAISSGQVPAAIFRAFGTVLLGIPYTQGSAATVSSTWTLADTLGHTIPAGTFVTVTGLAFYVQTDVVVAPASSTATVTLVANETGSAYNALTGPIATVDQIDWVLSIVIIGTTSGGADAEDDTDYQNGLANELALQAPRPITASDYAGMVLSPSATTATGVTVGRATAIDGFDPSVHTFTGTIANASTTMTAVSSFTGVTAGSILTASGIPANTTVVSINVGASTLVMSAAATAPHTAQSTTATGSYSNERTVTVFVTDTSGNAISGPNMTLLQTWLGTFREINFVVYVVAPTITTVYVTAEIHVLPSWDSAAVDTDVTAAITTYLNPSSWGSLALRGTGSSTWLNSTVGFNIVRYNKLLGIIEGVAGVDYVPTGSAGLAIGFSASPSGVVDLTLPGPAPLATSDSTTPTVIVTPV